MNTINYKCKYEQTCQNKTHSEEACRMKAMQYFKWNGEFVCPKCGLDEGIDFDTFVNRHPVKVCLNGFSSEKKKDAAKRRFIVTIQPVQRENINTIQPVQRESTVQTNITTHDKKIYNFMQYMTKKMDKLNAELNILRKKVLVIPDTPQIAPVDVRTNKVRRVESVNHQTKIFPTKIFTNGKRMPSYMKNEDSEESLETDNEDSEEKEDESPTKSPSFREPEKNESSMSEGGSGGGSPSFGESEENEDSEENEEEATNRPMTKVSRYQNVDIDLVRPTNVCDIGFENLRHERQGIPIRESGTYFNNEASLLRLERRYRRKNEKAVFKSGLTIKKQPPM